MQREDQHRGCFNQLRCGGEHFDLCIADAGLDQRKYRSNCMIQALSDVVVIRRSAPQEVSDGGIHLAWDSDYREDIGTVVSVGVGKHYGCKHCGTYGVRAPAVKPGDKVIFSTNGHQITVVNGEELVVLREPSIIGVIVE